MLKVTFWSVNARTGVVAGRLPFNSSSFSVDSSGGSFSGDLRMILTNRDGRAIDYSSLTHQCLNRTLPLFHTIVATDDQMRVLGEWIVLRRSRDTSKSSIAISGTSWESYPKFLAVPSKIEYGSTGKLNIARALLSAVFTNIEMTIPAGAAGSSQSFLFERLQGYYSDALSDLDSSPGLEWMVTTSPVWEGDRLTRVTRQVTLVQGKLQRATSLKLLAGEPGSRHGNCVITRDEDATRYARVVYTIGSGTNDKQHTGSFTDNDAWHTSGFLDSTRIEQAGNVEDQARLNGLAQAISASGREMQGPWKVTAFLDKLRGLPRPGDLVRLQHRIGHAFPGIGDRMRRRWAVQRYGDPADWPTAAEGAMSIDDEVRVGSVTYRTAGPTASTVEIEVA